MTRVDVLPEAQRALIPRLRPLQRLGFVLYGGTAIALQLGHRVSIDFDFFSDARPSRGALLDALPFLDEAITLQDDVDTWTVRSGPDEAGVKISFFTGLGFGRVGEPFPADDGHLLLASLDDLLGHRLKVLLRRVEAKDHRDIAAMLDAGQRLEDGLGAAVTLFPRLPPCEAARALVHFEGGDLASLSARDRAILIAHVGRLGISSEVARRSSRLAS